MHIKPKRCLEFTITTLLRHYCKQINNVSESIHTMWPKIASSLTHFRLSFVLNDQGKYSFVEIYVDTDYTN